MLKFDRDPFETVFNIAPTEGANKRPAKIKSPSLKTRARVIHHGVDTEVFKPLSESEKKKFRETFFGGKLKPSTYLVVNVSRNQPRKDMTRTLAAFAAFKKRVPDSHLYLHCKAHDAGGSIHEMARNFDLAQGRDYTVPGDFNAGVGYSVEIVNKIYNVADLMISTTLGEGWGFITTEAMATKTPIIAPNITSMLDIFNSYVPVDKDSGTSGKPPFGLNEWLFEKGGIDQVRGIPALAGSTTSEWICMGIEDNERIRPLTNVDDMVEKMVWAFTHPKDVEKIVERAFAWVQNLSWDKIVKEWDEVFMQAYDKLNAERVLGQAIDKAGRNDPCPCGSGEKTKRCHGNTDEMNKFADWFKDGEKSK
jgi:glycosyltransferase involved in cell wall biosynthesis